MSSVDDTNVEGESIVGYFRHVILKGDQGELEAALDLAITYGHWASIGPIEHVLYVLKRCKE